MSGLVNLDSLLAEAKEGVEGLRTRAELENLKARFVGPKGSLTQALKGINQLPKEERPAFGKRVNEVKRGVEGLFSGALEGILEKELTTTLGPVDRPLASES